jgi:hypothetical protein
MKHYNGTLVLVLNGLYHFDCDDIIFPLREIGEPIRLVIHVAHSETSLPGEKVEERHKSFTITACHCDHKFLLEEMMKIVRRLQGGFPNGQSSLRLTVQEVDEVCIDS